MFGPVAEASGGGGDWLPLVHLKSHLFTFKRSTPVVGRVQQRRKFFIYLAAFHQLPRQLHLKVPSKKKPPPPPPIPPNPLSSSSSFLLSPLSVCPLSLLVPDLELVLYFTFGQGSFGGLDRGAG